MADEVEHGYSLSGDEITRLRINNKLTLEELASRADMDVSSLKRIIAGKQRPFKRNAYAIAGALGVTLRELVEGYNPYSDKSDNQENRYEAILCLSTPYKDMLNDPNKVNDTIDILETLVGRHPIRFRKLHNGKTTLILDMAPADILRLLAAMMDNGLRRLEITEIHIPDHSWLLNIIALLHWSGNPSQPDPDTWVDLMDKKKWDELYTRTPMCFFCKDQGNIPGWCKDHI